VITLVLGGARSGKSTVAERLAGRLAGTVTYVATGTADDDDMAARIEAHRARRPPTWETVELVATDDLAPTLRATAGPVLLDALGTWLARAAAFRVDADALCDALRDRDGDTVVVSDEVGLGVHPSSEAGRRFRDRLGLLNRQVADIADDVLLVVAGRVLPLERVDR
jgi:adenosyl cobinamide kinase/adenosyl cobinamide phosphate guanylyltransferase